MFFLVSYIFWPVSLVDILPILQFGIWLGAGTVMTGDIYLRFKMVRNTDSIKLCFGWIRSSKLTDSSCDIGQLDYVCVKLDGFDIGTERFISSYILCFEQKMDRIWGYHIGT